MAENNSRVVYLDDLLAEYAKEQKENSGGIPHSIHAIGYHNGLTMAGVIARKLASDDAAPVVRCGKCRFWSRHTKASSDYGSCSIYGITKHENGFCDFGKKKDTGNDLDQQ